MSDAFQRETTGEHIRLLREDFRELRSDLKGDFSVVDGRIEGVKASHARVVYFVLAGALSLLMAGVTALWSLRGDIDDKTPLPTHHAAIERLEQTKADKAVIDKIDVKLDHLLETTRTR